MNFSKTDYTKNDNAEMQLLCPKCGFEYTHLLKVSQSNDSENRLSATLEFECENGCSFSYYIENHKGNTLSHLS